METKQLSWSQWTLENMNAELKTTLVFSPDLLFLDKNVSCLLYPLRHVGDNYESVGGLNAFLT